jgi:hypothetical protein
LKTVLLSVQHVLLGVLNVCFVIITYSSHWVLEMVPILVSVLWSVADARVQGVLLVAALHCPPIPLYGFV